MVSQRFERRAGWAGILFVVLFASGAVLGAVVGNSGNTRAEVAAAYSDGGDNTIRLLSTLLVALALVPFVRFLVGLGSRVGGRGGEERGLAAVALAGGVLIAGLLALANVLSVAVPASEEFLDDYVVDPGVAQTLEVAGWWMVNATSLAGTVRVGATALAARRTGFAPRWLWSAGVVVAVIGVFGLFTWGLSIILETLWLLVMAVRMMRGVAVERAARGAA